MEMQETWKLIKKSGKSKRMEGNKIFDRKFPSPDEGW